MNKLKEMDGQECWTDAFGDRFEERVCVLIEYPNCWNRGKKFKPTGKEINELWDDHIESELGPNWREDLDKEFGTYKTADTHGCGDSMGNGLGE